MSEKGRSSHQALDRWVGIRGAPVKERWVFVVRFDNGLWQGREKGGNYAVGEKPGRHWSQGRRTLVKRGDPNKTQKKNLGWHNYEQKGGEEGGDKKKNRGGQSQCGRKEMCLENCKPEKTTERKCLPICGKRSHKTRSIVL